MVSEILIHKIPEDAPFEVFEEIARCYAEIYHIEIFIHFDEKVMTTVEGEEVFVTDELLRRIRGSEYMMRELQLYSSHRREL